MCEGSVSFISVSVSYFEQTFFYLDCMQNDRNTIEENNYVTGVAGLLTKYGYAIITTDHVEKFLGDIHQRFGLKAFVSPRSNLPNGQHFIKVEN